MWRDIDKHRNEKKIPVLDWVSEFDTNLLILNKSCPDLSKLIKF